MKDKIFHIPYGSAAGTPAEPLSCRNGWTGNEGPEEAFVSAAWDEDALYVSFLTCGAHVVCRNFEDQAPVSDDSCVEVFLKPEPDGEYWNLEFNIAGYINASHRVVRPAKTQLTPAECASIQRKASIAVTEPLEDGGVQDWRFDIRVPWSILGVTPRKGLHLTGNFFACAAKAVPTYSRTWAPIDTEKPDFHRPEFFGDIILD